MAGALRKVAQQVREAGRYGDTELVHLRRDELNHLADHWGPPTRNPETGLPEYFLGDLAKWAMSVFQPSHHWGPTTGQPNGGPITSQPIADPGVVPQPSSPVPTPSQSPGGNQQGFLKMLQGLIQGPGGGNTPGQIQGQGDPNGWSLKEMMAMADSRPPRGLLRNNYADGSYVQDPGEGSGRDDNINARLSPGEYVFTAEDVSLLGDGNSNEGARRLDQFRENLREHKGAALAEGRISPDAKAPEGYLRGMN